MNKSIKFVIATHKKYTMPADPIYLPVQVEAAEKKSIGYARNDTGDNISSKKANYCELTGLYWLWKNAMSDVVGLVHYRRYFTLKKTKAKWDCIATENQLRMILKTAPIYSAEKAQLFY